VLQKRQCPGFGQDRVNFHRYPGRGGGCGCGGLLTPPGQTEQGIPYHVLSCWVPVGGSWAVGTHSQLRSKLWRRFGRPALWVVRFVLCIPIFCIVVVVTVPFVCCSVKLPLSQPTSFCLFLSILLPPRLGGGAAMWHFCCRPQPNHNKQKGGTEKKKKKNNSVGKIPSLFHTISKRIN